MKFKKTRLTILLLILFLCPEILLYAQSKEGAAFDQLHLFLILHLYLMCPAWLVT